MHEARHGHPSPLIIPRMAAVSLDTRAWRALGRNHMVSTPIEAIIA